MRAISSQTQVHIEGAAAHAAVLFRDEQKLNAELIRAAQCADDFDGAFVALVQVDQFLIGQASSWRSPSATFKLNFRVFLRIMGLAFVAERCVFSRILVGQFGQELQHVVDDADVRHLENRRFRDSC